MKKVSNRLYLARKIFDYAILVLLIIFLLFLWQLYRGPIAVPFLKPYIVAALNPDVESAEVSVDSVNIELVRSVRPIKIIANNVVYKRNDDSVRFSAPRTSVSFSIKALLRGIIAPASVEMEDPSVYIFTTYGVQEHDKASVITEKKLDYYVTQFEDFLERFNSEDKTYPESYINSISITGGEVEFHEVDLGRKWVLSDLNYDFNRGLSEISTAVSALLNLNDTVVSAGVDVGYRALDNKLAVQVYFGDLIPSEIINNYFDEKTRERLYQINVPVSGKITAMIDFNEFVVNRDDLLLAVDKAVKDIGFQFEGGQGSIVFAADDQESKYDISSFVLDGHIKGGLDNLEIKNADFNLGEQKVKLGFSASGLERLLLKSSFRDLKLKLTADIASLKLNDLYIYWPKYIVPEAWQWCKDGIFGGDAKNAHFEFDFGYDSKTKKFGFKDLKGGAYIEDSNIRYIDTMPMVTNVYGDFSVNSNSINIALDKAKSDGIMLDTGNVRIYDLDKYNNYISIKLISNSSISDALKLIDHPPHNFTSELGLKPDMLKGKAETELALDFELKNDLGYNDIKVGVKSKLQDVEMKDVFNGKDVKAQELALEVNNSGLKVEGEAAFDDIPVSVIWNERFKPDKNNNSSYSVKFKIDENVCKKLGIDFDVLKEPYIKGYADVTAKAVPVKGGYKIDTKADLKQAEIDYGFLGFMKPLGDKGELSAKLDIKNGKLASISSFDLTKSDFALNGKMSFNSRQQLSVIDIKKIKGPKTSANAKIEFLQKPKNKIVINISGNSYDLSDFFERKNSSQDKKSETDTDSDSWEKLPNMDINIAVNTLWSNPDVAVTNFAGTADIVNGVGISEVHLIGNYDYNKEMTLKVDYVPKPNKEFYLTIDSNAAGNTLRFLRIYKDMHGGNLHIEAKRGSDKMLIGHAKIRDFSIHNTPVLAKLLTVASFTGMVDLLTGEGMTFSHFDAPFKYKNSILYVNKARAYGNVLGISFGGAYNMSNDAISIEGMIAPAYGLNTMIGKIPLVGNLLAGKDGTIFAANYSISGTTDDANVRLNPLSALSPNSLKEAVASVFGKDEDDGF